MFHFFDIDEIKNAVDHDYLIRCADDDGDDEADDGILEWARQAAEDEVIAYVEAAPAGYDSNDWQVDDDGDGISDNINGLIKNLALTKAIWKIACRRTEIPDNIREMNAIADAQLARIQEGTLVLVAESVDATITGNMTEDDLGELTMDGGTNTITWGTMQ